MEALVGLLRGQARADSTSVELYLRKFEGLMISLNRIDYSKMKVEHCEQHLRVFMEATDPESKGVG